MDWLARVKRLLQREARDAREVLSDLEQRAEADLDRRERALSASPEERLQATLDEIATSDAAYERLKDDVEAGRRPAPE